MKLAIMMVIFGLFTGLGTGLARADDEVYTFVVKKQEEKKQTRWDLSDWITTRDKMRMQDLWLQLHSPSPYEFYLGGDYQMPAGDNIAAFQVGAYASIFGLEYWRESERWLGLFHLRLLGYHDQGTNITLEAGVKADSPGGVTYRTGLAGVSLTLYLNKFFGVDGRYRYYFAPGANSAGVTGSGNRYEGDVFIDFSLLRLFGGYFNETIADVTTTGPQLGMRFYF
jgi:hypothetical protein